jgi:hypothetical protein
VNPWSDKLGCEVNVCCAKQCDAERMRICALRKAYQERVAYLKRLLVETGRSAIRNRIREILQGLGADI